MSRISDLVDAYANDVARAWPTQLSGSERVWMLVYPPDLERQIRAALAQFALATTERGHSWQLVDVSDEFGRWLAGHRHAEAFFEDPSDLTPAILDQFESALAESIRDALARASADEVVALIGIGSIYPFLRASSVIRAIDDAVLGRLLVFFPGHHDPDTNSFRLLDARDGFNYRARVIDPQQEIA